jgi:steroid 5-alpha reductase family enzyme
MLFAWAVQRATSNSGWIDTIWSFSVGAGGIAAAIIAPGDPARRFAIAALMTVWSCRLAFHIGARSRGSGEDPRYSKLIDDWGEKASIRLLFFLQIQAAVAFVLVFAVFLAGLNNGSFPSLLDLVGVGLAVVAVCGEAISDYQLSRFRKLPVAKYEVCELGLWRYSRHPNYFFEWLFWCSWPLIASPGLFAVGAAVAPVLMYWLLVHVSGIPPLEEHMERTRGERFLSLQRRVNAFFPGPQKKGDVREHIGHRN